MIIVTLGIFYFLINVLMLFLTSWIVPDFDIDTFWWGCVAAIIVSLVNWIIGALLPEPEPASPARARVARLSRPSG